MDFMATLPIRLRLVAWSWLTMLVAAGGPITPNSSVSRSTRMHFVITRAPRDPFSSAVVPGPFAWLLASPADPGRKDTFGVPLLSSCVAYRKKKMP